MLTVYWLQVIRWCLSFLALLPTSRIVTMQLTIWRKSLRKRKTNEGLKLLVSLGFHHSQSTPEASLNVYTRCSDAWSLEQSNSIQLLWVIDFEIEDYADVVETDESSSEIHLTRTWQSPISARFTQRKLFANPNCTWLGNSGRAEYNLLRCLSCIHWDCYQFCIHVFRQWWVTDWRPGTCLKWCWQF